MSELLFPVDYDQILRAEVQRIAYPYDQPPVCKNTEGYYRNLVLSAMRDGDVFYDELKEMGQTVVAMFDHRMIVGQDDRQPLIPEPVKVLIMNPSGSVKLMPEAYQTRNFLVRAGTGNYYAGRVHRDQTCSPLRSVNTLASYRTAGHAYGSTLHEVLEYHFQL